MCAQKYDEDALLTSTIDSGVEDQTISHLTGGSSVALINGTPQVQPFNPITDGALAYNSDPEEQNQVVRPEFKDNPLLPTAETGQGNQSPVFFSIGSSKSQELIEAKSQVNDLEAQLSEKRVETNKLQEELDKVTQEKNETHLKLKKIEHAFKTYSELKELEITSLRHKIDSYKKKLSDKEKENEKLRKDHKVDIKKLEEKLGAEEKKHGEQVVKLTTEICNLKLELKNHEIVEERLSRQIAEAKQETLQLKNDQLQKECELEREASQASLKKSEEKRALDKADSDAEIQRLKRLLSEASFSSQVSSDSTADNATG